MNFKPTHTLILLSTLATLAFSASAQTRTDDYHLNSPDPQWCSFFGVNLVSDGEWLLSGTFTCTGNGVPGGGMMAVYRRTSDGYDLQQVLNETSAPNQFFIGETGIDLAASTLVASCYTWPDQFAPLGKAYLFERNASQWSLTGELTQTVSVPRDGYGQNVATSGDTVFVSAHGAGPIVNGNYTLYGAIYIYKKIAGVWTEVQLWMPPANTTFLGALAGKDMVADQETLVWGGPGNKLFIMEPDLNGVWDLTDVIGNITTVPNDNHWAIDVEGDTMVVGIQDEFHQALGSVQVFRRVNGIWGLDVTIQAPDPGTHGDGFGTSVDLKGDLLAIGAPQAGNLGGAGRSPGAAYLFERDSLGTWNFKYKFVRPDGDDWDELGDSIAIGDEYLLVGDRSGTVPPAQTPGGAFVFELPLGQDLCPGVANSTGAAAELEVVGTAEVGTNWLTVRATGLPPGQSGYFLASDGTGFLPGLAGGQGTLCLGGTLTRFNQPGMWGPASLDGVRELHIDTLGPLGTYGPPLLAGQAWAFQFWYRDHNPMPTSNLSSAAQVLFR